jgi:hypothetical protein
MPKRDIIDRLRSAGDRDEGRPYLDMHDAANEIERLRAIIAGDTHILLSRRPVAWRVQDHPGCWMLFQDEEKARMIGHGRLMQGLYARDEK